MHFALHLVGVHYCLLDLGTYTCIWNFPGLVQDIFNKEALVAQKLSAL